VPIPLQSPHDTCARPVASGARPLRRTAHVIAASQPVAIFAALFCCLNAVAMPILSIPPLNTTIAAVLTVTASAWGLPAAAQAA